MTYQNIWSNIPRDTAVSNFNVDCLCLWLFCVCVWLCAVAVQLTVLELFFLIYSYWTRPMHDVKFPIEKVTFSVAQLRCTCPYFHQSKFSLFFWSDSPQWARASSFTKFLDHTQRHFTVSRTPLDEWSARHRGFYLTTHNRQTSMPQVGFEPTISAGERPQT